MTKPPTLVVGVHRSGTSVTTNSLRTLGLFTGARCDSNGESTFFQRLNRRLSSEAGGHWTTPATVYESLIAIDDLASFVAPLVGHLEGPGAVEYWGRHAFKRRFEGHWGWKDPRNGSLLPLWTALYPELQIVWVRRDPRACAASLVNRSRRIRQSIEEDSQRNATGLRWQRINDTVRGRPLLAAGWRSLRPEAAFEIALRSAELHQEILERAVNPVTVMDYEDLVQQPRLELERCAQSIGLRPGPQLLREVASRVRTTTPAVHPPEFASLADTHRARIAAIGYGP